MTLTNLRTLMTDFMSVDLDNFRGESPTDPQKTEQINRAYRLIAKRCALFDPKITFTLEANTFKYPLRHTTYATYFGKRIVRPIVVTIAGSPLYTADGSKFGLWTMEELFRQYPDWQTAAAAQPWLAVNTGTHLLVHAKASAAAAALSTHFVAGQYIPPDLSSDGDIPDLPEEIHEALAYAGAEYAGNPMVVDDEMLARIQRFRAEWFDIVEDIRGENLLAINDPGTDWSETYSDVVWV